MAISPNETAIRSSAEAARNFVEPYYQAINDGKPVASYYVNASQIYRAAGHPLADLCINGLVVGTPEEWDKLLQTQRHVPATHGGRPSTARYEVESYDTHVVNPDYRFAAPPALLIPDPSKPDHGAGARIMLMVTVSGTLHFGSDRDALRQHFNDVFVLVPNWDVMARHGTKGNKRFLAASHTYRAY